MNEEWNIVFSEAFDESFEQTISYLRYCGTSENFIDEFVDDLETFINEKIAPRPLSHTEFKYWRIPNKSFRRAIFKKKYYIIYKVYDERLEFRLFISSKRDLTKISIQD